MDTVAKDSFLSLADGRTLGYETIGDPDGVPMVFFHGTPGSRLILTESDLLAQVSNLRLILPDRPGYGISTAKADGSIADWSSDVRELADALGLDSFVVAGVSGGGPYALACAARLKDRVRQVLLFNSAAPIDYAGAKKGVSLGNRIGYRLTRSAPWLMKVVLDYNVKAFKKSPDTIIRSLVKQLPEPDRDFMKDDSFVAALIRDMNEAYRSGGEGHFRDAQLIHAKNGWGFQLDEIAVPVHLWHGEMDTLSPIQSVKRMAAEIPLCHATYLPESGHLLIDRPDVVQQAADALSSNN